MASLNIKLNLKVGARMILPPFSLTLPSILMRTHNYEKQIIWPLVNVQL